MKTEAVDADVVAAAGGAAAVGREELGPEDPTGDAPLDVILEG